MWFNVNGASGRLIRDLVLRHMKKTEGRNVQNRGLQRKMSCSSECVVLIRSRRSGIAREQGNSVVTRQGDFMQLLKERGYRFGHVPGGDHALREGMSAPAVMDGTTVLAMKYRDGVIVAGDRRATAGNMVMYDRTDKVLELDRYSVMAIAGVPATAFEMARVLEHSFKYYRRSQLQDLSFEGKLRALTQLLKDNVPAALAGTGAVAPVFCGYDRQHAAAKIFFYDILGARFEGVEYAMSGSGSPAIKGILHYLDRWGERRLSDCSEDESVALVLRLLVSAAEFDSATGGVDHESHRYPVVKRITRNGVSAIDEAALNTAFETRVLQRV